MTLIAVVVLPVSMTMISLVMKHSQKYLIQQQNSLGDVNGHIEEMYGGHQVVKAFNGEEKSVEQFEKYNESLYTSAWKSQFFGSLMMPISNFVGNIGYVGVCIIGGILAGSKTITIGDIQAFIQYVRQFNQPISQIAQAANLLQSTGAAAERVFEFLEEEELTEDSATLTTEEVQNMKGAVTFADVHFGYNPDKIIINDFSLHVHAGQLYGQRVKTLFRAGKGQMLHNAVFGADDKFFGIAFLCCCHNAGGRAHIVGLCHHLGAAFGMHQQKGVRVGRTGLGHIGLRYDLMARAAAIVEGELLVGQLLRHIAAQIGIGNKQDLITV